MDKRVGRARTAVVAVAAVAAVAVALALQLRSGPDSLQVAVEARPNILLISFDTLRADRLGCYGHTRDTSPTIDALARRSTWFDSAWAPTPWTLPSHVGMLTGRHPFEVGIKDSASSIPVDVVLASEILADAGYQTAAFVDSRPDGFVGAKRGFARGFETYDHLRGTESDRYTFDFARTRARAQSWLEARDRSRPFFLFLHTKGVHTQPAPPEGTESAPQYAPYRKPEPYQTMFVTPEQARLRWETDGARGVGILRRLNAALSRGRTRKEDYPTERLRALEGFYDGGIRYVDDQLRHLLDFVRREGLEEQTAIIVTADHGEAFLEHRFFLHREPRPQTLRVPLLVHRPGQKLERRGDREAWLEDVAPTVLDLATVAAPPAMTGRSLLDPAGERGPHFSYYQYRADYSYYAHAVREGRWKLIVERVGRGSTESTRFLYDVSSDPDELRPVDDEKRSSDLQRLLQSWIEQHRDSVAPEIEISLATAERLRALGYAE